MPVLRRLGRLLVALSFGAASTVALADETRVAVASNVLVAGEQLARRFETDTGHRVTLISGSTGKLFAQAINGAPFDVFLAADMQRPQALHARGLAQQPFTYARGRLVLIAATGQPPASPEAWPAWLASEQVRTFAIANPSLAPYGAAALQTLEYLGLKARDLGRVVRGENVAQAYQFVASGNADAGLVARSLVHNATGGRLVPETMHDPILQGGALLRPSAAAVAFVTFVTGETGQAILRDHGFDNAE